MHPGNILVTKDGRVAFIDCGICIKLSPKLHDHMIAILGAVSRAVAAAVAPLSPQPAPPR